VVINSNKQELVDRAIDRLSKQVPGVKLIGAAADLSTAQGVEELLKKVPAVDILVNSVGFYVAKDFLEISDDDWDQMMNLNFMSGVRLSRAYLRGMKERNWGRIIFISSESGVKIPYEMIHYGVSKAAQIAVARGIAETTTGAGVTVNSVLPGPTRSEGVEAFIQQMVTARGIAAEQVVDEFFKTVRPTSIIKRFILPEEVASLVAYLCSPLASATNGAAFRVDGGVVASIP
jgi:NAD(P)-dependent dehydrogenase (short-subunit alcohol dehydrogenase family)